MNWTHKMEVNVGDKFKLENFRLTATFLRNKYTVFTMVYTVALRTPVTTFYDCRTTDLQEICQQFWQYHNITNCVLYMYVITLHYLPDNCRQVSYHLPCWYCLIKWYPCCRESIHQGIELFKSNYPMIIGFFCGVLTYAGNIFTIIVCYNLKI